MNSVIKIERRLSLLGFLCILISAVLLPAQSAYAASDKYVVNLLSLQQNVDLSLIKNFDELKRSQNVIVYSKVLDGKKKYVLSVGYFSSYQAAKKIAIKLGKAYKGAYAVKFASSYSVIKSIKRLPSPLTTKPLKPASPLKPVSVPAPTLTSKKSASALNQDQLDKIMRSATSTLPQDEYKKKIQ